MKCLTPLSLLLLAYLTPAASAQSLTIGPNGVSVTTGQTASDVTLRLDNNGLSVRSNQPVPARPSTTPAAPTRLQPRTQTLNCAGRAVNISGSGGRVNLMGRCPSVTISGSRNTVSIEQVGKITVRGSSNSVTWRKALAGARPVLSVSGSGNRVTGTTYVATTPAPVRTTPAPVRTTPVRAVTPVRTNPPSPTPSTPATTTPVSKPPQTIQPLN